MTAETPEPGFASPTAPLPRQLAERILAIKAQAEEEGLWLGLGKSKDSSKNRNGPQITALYAEAEALLHQETQASVAEWVETTFPGERGNIEGRFDSLLEEVLELGLALAQDPDRMISVAHKVIDRSLDTFGKEAEVPGEIGDVELCLGSLAQLLGYDKQVELDRKMQKNRSRPQSYYDAKQQLKIDLGIRR